jgi:hypothetical protein
MKRNKANCSGEKKGRMRTHLGKYNQRLMSADFNRIKTLDNSAVWEDDIQDLQSRVQFKLDSSQKRGKNGYSLNFFE